MNEQEEEVEATAVEDGPEPELAPAVDEFLSGELAISDVRDTHEQMVVMDNHDTAMLLQQIQSSALKKWVYKLPGRDGATGLTVHAVQDIVQRMNWTGKASVGVLPETLTVEEITQDGEPYWVATIFAKDEHTGSSLPGTSMEPQRMRLRPETAAKKREDGAQIPEDNTVFDKFSRTKAIAKATRNAMAGFIPEEIEQTVISMFENDPRRVERIQTKAEEEASKLPPAVTDEEGKALIARCEAIYDEIRECADGQGKVKMPPGMFKGWMLSSQHDHDALRRMVGHLEERLAAIPGEVRQENIQRQAAETFKEVACPGCGAPRFKPCVDGKGKPHRERFAARVAQLEA